MSIITVSSAVVAHFRGSRYGDVAQDSSDVCGGLTDPHLSHLNHRDLPKRLYPTPVA